MNYPSIGTVALQAYSPRYATMGPTQRARAVLAMFFMLVSPCMALSAEAVDELRPYAVDDVFKLESLGQYFGGPFSFSPDGTLAFSRTRPVDTVQNHHWEWLDGNAASDVWLQSGSHDPINLTLGAADGSGWWAPEWSPDGRYLAMLSTRGNKVCVWLWDTQSAKLSRMSDRAVAVRGDSRGLWWIDNHTLLFVAEPEGSSSARLQMGLTTPEAIAREWAKAPAGTQRTSSVLESGALAAEPHENQGQLLSLSVPAATVRTILDTRPTLVSPSPSGELVAVVHTVPGPAPATAKPIAFDNDSHVFDIVRADGTEVPIDGPRIITTTEPTLEWSPGGNRLAILGLAEENGGTSAVLHIVAPDAGTSRRMHLKSAKPGELPFATRLVWAGEDSLLLHSQETGDKPDSENAEWWLVRVDGKIRKLGGADNRMPANLWAQTDRAALVGLAADKLVRVMVDGTIEALGGDLDVSVTSLDWPFISDEGDVLQTGTAQGVDEIIFSTGHGASRRTWIARLSDGHRRSFNLPAGDARLVAYDPMSRSVLFLRDDERGLYLWRIRQDDARSFPLIVANTFLQRVQPAEARQIHYKSLSGTELTAWLLLPPDRKPGHALPLLTYVYPGSVVSDRLPWNARLTTATPMNLQIPAARGYAVLIPSMPSPDAGTEPMSHLLDGVMPAVDQAMREVLLDPDRLYLLGHSFGGYAVLGLLTQTNRFSAAVSMAGISNLVSMYGEFDARQRYQSDAAPAAMFGMLWTEVGQAGMKQPPWEAPDRYQRNSPLFHADKISTPVMLVHGDLDAVPIQQAEQMFTALYRQGKRARFVRYWGEGHILQSPANVRDLWARIFAWFDEQPEEGAGRASTDSQAEAPH